MKHHYAFAALLQVFSSQASALETTHSSLRKLKSANPFDQERKPEAPPGKGEHGPPDQAQGLKNVKASLLDVVNLDNNAKVSFVKVANDDFVLDLLVLVEGKSDANAAFDLTDDVDILQIYDKATNGKKPAPGLTNAASKMQAQGKNKWPKPDNYETIDPQQANQGRDESEDDGRMLQESRKLCLTTGGSAHPSYSWGSRDWWRYWYCGKSGSLINDSECQCYWDLYNTGWSTAYKDNYMKSSAHAYSGNLKLQISYWTCSGWWIWETCSWQAPSFTLYVNEGQVGNVWSSGSNVWRRMGISSSSPIFYDWSVYTTHDSLACSNSCETNCDFCPNRNW